MEYVDIPCCGDKTLCGASAEDDCKTSIAIPIIPMDEHDDDIPSGIAGERKENRDKVRGLAGGQEGSWMESEKWIGREPVGADQAWRTLKVCRPSLLPCVAGSSTLNCLHLGTPQCQILSVVHVGGSCGSRNAMHILAFATCFTCTVNG